MGRIWKKITDGYPLFGGRVWIFIEPRDAFIGVSKWHDCTYIVPFPCCVILVKSSRGDR